jgi:hypothetical protein
VLGRYQEIIDKYEDLPHSYVPALLMAGQFERVRDEYPEMHWYRLTALRHMGLFHEAIEDSMVPRWQHALALLEMDPEAVRATFGDDHVGWAHAMVDLGMAEQAIQRPGLEPAARAYALLACGRYREVVASFSNQNIFTSMAYLYLGDTHTAIDSARDAQGLRLARTHRALEYQIDGKQGKAAALFDTLQRQPYVYTDLHSAFGRFLLPPFIAFLDGDRDAVAKAYGSIADGTRYRFGQRLWHHAAFVVGRIDSARFVAQPSGRSMEGRLLLAQAMRAELLGRPGADSLYARYASLPYGMKEINPVVDRFVRWRRDAGSGITSQE